MARKRLDEDADDERDFRGKFITELNKATTLADAAMTVDMPIMLVEGLPFTGNIGRLRRSSLDHFLRGFEATGGNPPYRVKRTSPIIPSGATLPERKAYSRLVMRLAESGQIDAADAKYVADLIEREPVKPSDFM